MTLLTLLSPQGDAPPVETPFGGAAWVWPKSRRDRRHIDDTPEEALAEPVVSRAEPVALPKFDIERALAAAREAARSAVGEEVALRRTERRLAAVAATQARARAKAQADALAKVEADEEDDLETILLGGW